jgi:acylphosphatase
VVHLRLKRNVLTYSLSKMLTRAHIFVSGQVQGVFFRDHTQRWAASLGLMGWVRNVMGGRVEIMVEGHKENIQSLLGKLNQGPPLARVDSVDVEWEDHYGEFEDFRITW